MKQKIGLLLLFLYGFLLSNAQTMDFLFSPEGIAEIHIHLLNDKNINDIKNSYDVDYSGKLEAEMVIQNSTQSGYDPNQLYTGQILIEGRGYSSWWLPKKPYNIDLITLDGSDNPMPLLNMPTCDEWSLLTFGFDKSLMRFPLSMFIGRHMSGIKWTPRTRYVELWIDDEYRGLYCLTEKVKRDDNRIAIKKLNAESTNLSGGYILEQNTKHLSEDELSSQIYTNIGHIPFIFKYPKPKNVTSEQVEWVKNYLNEFESILWSDRLKDPVNGYRKYIDEASFIDWTILQEQAKDPDHQNNISNFLHKDRDGKLNMSAPWDFDRAYGNEIGGEGSTEGNGIRLNHWYAQLAEDEDYLENYKKRFYDLTPFFHQIPDVLEANYQQLKEAGVIDRESQKWADLPGGTNLPGYEEQVQYLSDWFQARHAWCYTELGLPATINPIPAFSPSFTCYYSKNNILNISYVASKHFNLKIQLLGIDGVCLKNVIVGVKQGENHIQLSISELGNRIGILRLFTEMGVKSKKIAIL
jgi:hypothetical protein